MGNQLVNNEPEPTVDTYYADLKAIGVNIDAVKQFSPTLSQLRQFHDNVMAILLKAQK
jgi:hypothetical protein